MARQSRLEEALQTCTSYALDSRSLVSIGLSILSWRGAEALRPALESYQSIGFFDLFDEAQIYLPDPDKAVLDVASKFDVETKTSPKNLGIMGNMIAAAEQLSTDYILILENDCPLIEPLDEVKRQLKISIDLLESKDVIMSRLRSVREPGQAFTGLGKYRRLYDGTLRSFFIRKFRRDHHRRLSGYALYDGQQSIERHTDHFEYVGDETYLVDASIMPWTNQSILINREFFLDKIIPMARSVKTRRHANSLPNLEIEMNKSRQWRRSGWKIACGPGLFTHERIGDRGYL